MAYDGTPNIDSPSHPISEAQQRNLAANAKYEASLINDARGINTQIEASTLRELRERIASEWVHILTDGDHVIIRYIENDDAKKGGPFRG